MTVPWFLALGLGLTLTLALTLELLRGVLVLEALWLESLGLVRLWAHVVLGLSSVFALKRALVSVLRLVSVVVVVVLY